MNSTARWLFTIAALFNWSVGASLFLAYPSLAPLMGLPTQPTVWIHIVAAIVIVFGYAYWRIANDPRRFREYVTLGIVAKLAFVIVIYAHFLRGTANVVLAVLVTGDLIFAVLFGWYLKTSDKRLRW
jgi:hypothetical protein